MIQFLLGFFATLALSTLCGTATAQDFPNKPIRFVLPQPPGGAVDLISRTLGMALTKNLKQPVIVENRPGANGILAAEHVLKSDPDGYTLFFAVDTNLVVNHQLYAKVPYDPMRDFAPISIIAQNGLVLVANNSLALNNVADVIAMARAAPGKLNYGSIGFGSQHHLGMELLKAMAKVDLLHVPYTGQPAALAALVQGSVGIMMSGTPAALALSKAGQIKLLAATSLDRSKFLPDLPTVSEAGLSGFDVTGWFGLVAPAATPASVLGKLQQEVIRATQDVELRATFVKVGLEVLGATPEQMLARMKTDTEKWGRVIKSSGAKIE